MVVAKLLPNSNSSCSIRIRVRSDRGSGSGSGSSSTISCREQVAVGPGFLPPNFLYHTALALFKKTLAKKTSALDSPDICTFTAPSN